MKTIVVTVSNGYARREDEFEVEDDLTEEEIQKYAFEEMLQMIDWNYYEKGND